MGKSAFLANFPVSAAYEEHIRANYGEDAIPIVAGFTFNSDMSAEPNGNDKPCLGLRACLVEVFNP
jgi:hypothetical protein